MFYECLEKYNDRIICDLKLDDIVEYYRNDAFRIIKLYPYQNIPENMIWSILTSGKYSIHAKQMDENIKNQNILYIRNCIDNKEPINIVLAGLPGKCANRNKVFHSLPDIGEFAILSRFEQLDTIIKTIHSPGIKVNFMSDYIGLKITFFPIVNEINQYIEKIQSWKSLFNLDYNIYLITKILPELEIMEKKFILQEIPILLKNIPFMKFESQLLNSINDNINMRKAQEFYKEFFYNINHDEILKISYTYYKYFWKFFSEKNSVQNFFGNCIYASPVAYHPEKRLCFRLQSRIARIAPWNGVGYISKNKIYSIDERICNSKGYSKIYDVKNYFWGYTGI